jgi:hypothetical protein
MLNLQSIINIGTKAKPNKMTVEAARDYAKELAKELLQQIKAKEQELNF